jgi:hypothetical protein
MRYLMTFSGVISEMYASACNTTEMVREAVWSVGQDPRCAALNCQPCAIVCMKQGLDWMSPSTKVAAETSKATTHQDLIYDVRNNGTTAVA